MSKIPPGIHWPRLRGVGIECSCGTFKIGGVTFEEACRRWWTHVLKVAQ